MMQFASESAVTIFKDESYVIRLSKSYLIVHKVVDGKEQKPAGYLEGTNFIRLPK